MQNEDDEEELSQSDFCIAGVSNFLYLSHKIDPHMKFSPIYSCSFTRWQLLKLWQLFFLIENMQGRSFPHIDGEVGPLFPCPALCYRMQTSSAIGIEKLESIHPD